MQEYSRSVILVMQYINFDILLFKIENRQITDFI